MELSVSAVRVIITIVNFVILMMILKHFFFKKVTDVISARQEEIANSINTTNENEELAKINKAESEKELKNSKAVGKNIVEEHKAKAQILVSDIVKEAKTEAQTIIERAVKEAEREKEKAEDELKNQAIDLALIMSTKALEESIDEEQHRRLIKDFIAKVGI